MLPAQVLGEFANVIRRKFPAYAAQAADQISDWAATFAIIPTTEVEVEQGTRFALRHRLQGWDAIVWQAAAFAGAEYLLSEDMQDGLTIDGLTVVDPFNPVNAALIDALLTPMDIVERP